MNITRWDPFRDFGRVFPLHPLGAVEANADNWQPAVDIRETKDAYQVDVALPAVDPKDVRIELRDGALSLTGERHRANAEDDGRVTRRELRTGKFTRSFRLPEDADPEAIRATAKNGLVSITVGKSERGQARSIPVEEAA